MKANLLNGANLAFIGDAYYELAIRRHLIEKGLTNQNDLHKECVKYVSAKAHSMIYKKMEEEGFLESSEVEIFKRGRNHSYHIQRKNLDYSEYVVSSGFEAVVGYLYLMELNDRLQEVIDFSIKVIEDKNE